MLYKGEGETLGPEPVPEGSLKGGVYYRAFVGEKVLLSRVRM